MSLTDRMVGHETCDVAGEDDERAGSPTALEVYCGGVLVRVLLGAWVVSQLMA